MLGNRQQNPRLWLSWGLLCAFSLCATAHGATWYVDADASGDGGGTTWTNAFTTVDAAVAAASAKDEIWIAAGDYVPASSYGWDLFSAVIIRGGFAGTEADADEADPKTNRVWLKGDKAGDGQQAYQIFFNRADGTAFSGLILSGAQTGLRSGSDYTMTDCWIVSNGSTDENSDTAGIKNSGGTIEIENCRFFGNRGMVSGGLDNQSCTVSVKRCVFADNVSETVAGAIGNVDAKADIQNSLFVRNQTQVGPGPGVYSTNESQVTITHCTFADNVGPHGLCVCNFAPATTQVRNCILMGASAAGHNELTYTEESARLVVGDCLIPAPLTEIYTIHHADYGKPATDGGGNVILADPGFVNRGDPVGADTFYGTADDGLALAAGSGAIDKANASYTLNIDLPGNGRPSGAASDLGAYEYGAAPSPTLDFTADISTYWESYAPGSRHAAKLIFTGTHPSAVDVYVVLGTPFGTVLFLEEQNQFAASGTPKYLSNWTVEALSENVLTLSLPDIPRGAYTWLVVVTPAGDDPFVPSNWLTSDSATWQCVDETY